MTARLIAIFEQQFPKEAQAAKDRDKKKVAEPSNPKDPLLSN